MAQDQNAIIHEPKLRELDWLALVLISVFGFGISVGLPFIYPTQPPHAPSVELIEKQTPLDTPFIAAEAIDGR